LILRKRITSARFSNPGRICFDLMPQLLAVFTAANHRKKHFFADRVWGYEQIVQPVWRAANGEAGSRMAQTVRRPFYGARKRLGIIGPPSEHSLREHG